MRVHIFVDAENINPKIFKRAYYKLKAKYEIAKCDVYGNQKNISSRYKEFVTNNKVVFHNVFFGKNSADTFMCTDITKACYTEPLTEVFAIITEDRDFSCVIKVLVDNNKETICVTEQNKLMTNLEAMGVDLHKITNMEITTIDTTKSNNHTCFIKFGNKIKEIPFYNGIAIKDFGEILHEYNLRKYYPKNRRLSIICADNLLKVVNNCVYFMKEDEYK